MIIVARPAYVPLPVLPLPRYAYARSESSLRIGERDRGHLPREGRPPSFGGFFSSRLYFGAGVKPPEKITLGKRREMGIRGLLVYCLHYKCTQNVEISADQWPDHVRLSDLEPSIPLPSLRAQGRRSQSGFQLGQQAKQKSPSVSGERDKPARVGRNDFSGRVSTSDYLARSYGAGSSREGNEA